MSRIARLANLSLKTGALLAALPALVACGFTPLYAVHGVEPRLTTIQVVRPDGRTGYLLGQALDQELAHDPTKAPDYRLTMRLKEIRIPRGINVNNVASRYEVDMSTTYILMDAHTRKVVTQGVVSLSADYDSANQPYAGIAAELNGEQRVAEQTAQRIRLELASYFASPRPTPSGSAAASGAGVATFTDRLEPQEVQSPRERALGGASPGATTVDPYGGTGADQPQLPNTSQPQGIITLPDADAPDVPAPSSAPAAEQP